MQSPSLSHRVRSLRPSATLAMGARAAALRKKGVKVINFALGEPDFDTPEVVKQAAIAALRDNQTHYAPTLGDMETRSAIAEKLGRENGIPGLTGQHVAISAGAKHSLYLVCQCLLDPDGSANEVLLPVPSWISYAPIAQLAGGRVVELPAGPATDFCITPEQFRRAVTPRTRMLILNTPSNPCGTMYPPETLRALAAAAAEAASTVAPELVIVVDEIYEKIVYGEHRHLSIGSLPDVAERTVTINGLSKAFAMTGWRVGYAACPSEFGLSLVRGMDTLQGQMTSCITSFVYPAIRAALNSAGAETEQMRARFAARAELAWGLASDIPGVETPKPTGAFYLFPDVSAHFGKRSAAGRLVRDSVEFAEALLDECHVAVVPGVEFGGCGDRRVRLSFACSEDEIEEGMGRLGRFVHGLRGAAERDSAAG